MAQAIVVQQEALARAQARIEQLERAAAARPAAASSAACSAATTHRAGRDGRRRPAPRRGGPWSQPYGPAGGGFLAGAAQTALGVAGGVLIADALADLFTADEAAAAEPAPPEDDLAADDGFDSDIGLDDF